MDNDSYTEAVEAGFLDPVERPYGRMAWRSHNEVENFDIPCPGCGSIFMRITGMFPRPQGPRPYVDVVLNCLDCSGTWHLSIGQDEDFIENGCRPIVRLYTD